MVRKHAALTVLAAMVGGCSSPPNRADVADALVNDRGRALSGVEHANLSGAVALFVSKKGKTIAVVIEPELSGIDPHERARARGTEMETGGLDIGVVLLVAPNDGRVAIATDKETADQLTDAECSEIIREQVIPLARRGQTGAALMAGVEAIKHKIDAPN